MLWIKALHIGFVISWFAGIFYLPRLFVNSAMATDPATQQQLAVMQRKLYRFMTGLAVLAVLFGIALLAGNWGYFMSQSWMHAKLALVLALIIYHWQCGRYVTAFEEGPVDYSHTYFRFFNELPVLAMFAIVILVVVRPF
ncbi:MAG: CopD family protein [Pseudomonadales bacterium]